MSEDVEARVRDHYDAGATEKALTVAIEEYGSEVFGFLVSRLRDEDTAGDVFSQTCEDLWRTLGDFGWRCSMRTWMYKLARSAAARHLRSPHNSPGRRVPLSQVSEAAARVRTRTKDFRRTEVKDGLAQLRDALDEEDQMLLTLRIDRELDWNDIARVITDEELDDKELARASARLRQRFKTIKERLRERAIAAGIIPGER